MKTSQSEPPILLLHKWPASRFERLWVAFKIFCKEGLLQGDWSAVFARRAVGGNVTLPQRIVQGLKALKINFVENRFDKESDYSVCYVVKDVRCLSWALRQKRFGRIRRLVAGPMIVNFPEEAGRIIEDPGIDVFLLPSPWIKGVFEKHSATSLVNYRVWPLGIDVDEWRPKAGSVRDQWILYVKNPEAGLVDGVMQSLVRRNLSVKILRAGHFTQAEYQASLQKASAVIFLSRTETQGLAMFEAWAYDVPTLHWNVGEFRLGRHRFSGASSCPYLTAECGMDFRGLEDFETSLSDFQKRLTTFTPRRFVVANHSLEKSIGEFLLYKDSM